MNSPSTPYHHTKSPTSSLNTTTTTTKMTRLPSIQPRDNAPCPRANGTTIGTDQPFILLCGSNVVGDVLDRPDASDFTQCVDLCASHHPKCEAVSFNGKRCELRANLKPDKTRPARFFDAAVAQFPPGGASSNCASTGGAQTVQPNGVSFGTFCNFIINGKDLGQNFAATFQDCMGQCAGTTGCDAASFDASMAQGFKNCYMKTGATEGDNIADAGIDTAIVQANAAAVPDPDPVVPVAPVAPVPTTVVQATTVIQPTTVIPDPVTVSATPEPAVTTVPLPEPVVSTTAGAVVASGASFFTPPAATTSAAAPIVSVATETVISIITSVSVSDAISVTQVMTIPVTTEITATVPVPLATSAADTASTSSATAQIGTADGANAGDSTSSRAWIAAPVVGSIAALVVVVIVFVMLGRRRRRPGTGTSATTTISTPSPTGSMFHWLPGSPRFRSRLVGNTNSGMGNFSSVTGVGRTVAEPARASVRSSVLGLWKPGGGGGGERLDDVEEGDDRFAGKGEKAGTGTGETPVYEVRNGRMELRESMNGLGLNRWSEK